MPMFPVTGDVLVPAAASLCLTELGNPRAPTRFGLLAGSQAVHAPPLNFPFPPMTFTTPGAGTFVSRALEQ